MVERALHFVLELMPEAVAPVHEVGEKVADGVGQVGAGLAPEGFQGDCCPEGPVGVETFWVQG